MARTERKKQSARGSLVELFTIVAVALLLALGIQAFLIKPFRIPSESMEPTLQVGQRVLVDRVSNRFGDPDRGDVVVFKPPAGSDSDGEQCGRAPAAGAACATPTRRKSDTNFIKRVVAVGGDRLRIVNGHAVVNGKRQPEPFARIEPGCDRCNLPREVTIPRGYYFMMGDNRGESQDSRFWGPVPKDWIIGQAFVTYWPPGRIGTL